MLILLATATVASAQWSDTNNLFLDSLGMPVCTEADVQEAPVVLQSYPDGGSFIIWQDRRAGVGSPIKIYAQKYDVNGNALWANNGVQIGSGPNARHYKWSSGQDYRSRSVAATDSAGGFYIAYADDSVTNYVWQRACVQHMRSNGTAVFPGVGFIVASSTTANLNVAAQLIPDGNKGFFIAYASSSGHDYINVYCYKDENGTMKLYGGGRVNENAIQRSVITPCGIRTYIEYPGTSVIDYNIWPDGEGGCNVVVSMNGNTADQYQMLAYNRIWRAKKTSLVRTYFRNTSGAACPKTTSYKNGDVYLLYSIVSDYINTACGSGSTAYTYTSYRLLSNGYYLIDGGRNSGLYDLNYPKGTTITTPGNINVDVIAVTKRTYINNMLSNFTVQGYAYPAEKFDSIPYQRSSYNNPEFGFNPNAPAQMDKLDHFRDTLLAASNYYPNFSLAGGGNHIYAAGLMSTAGDRLVRLQHLGVERKTSNSFAVEYKTSNKHGVVIGKELNTGFSGSNISYDFPIVTVSNTGNALFYVREYNRSARVSPIINGAELAWGAMGKSISTGVFNGAYYNVEQPHVALLSSGSGGIIGWRDNKPIPPGGTGDNIFMRRLDSLVVVNYQPPLKPVRLIPNPYGGTIANPAVLLGTSKKYSTIEYSALNHQGTPVIEVLDNYNFGKVEVSMVQNSSTIRRHNNHPYLDRNFTIKVENNPTGANINLRLFFTAQEFNALKNADASIITPGDLVVIKQPNNILTTPTTYTPLAGEEIVKPVAWSAVAGGYYIEIVVKGFSNFYIQKTAAAGLCNGQSTSITSSITGTNYQWQVNTGNGFVNINDNSNYAGTNTATLQLNNIPSSWYGYKYRAVVNGNNSYEVSLKFIATWTGSVNTTWENAANWSCGIVPDNNTDVVLSNGAVVVTSNVSVSTLKVDVGAILKINSGFILNVLK